MRRSGKEGGGGGEKGERGDGRRGTWRRWMDEGGGEEVCRGRPKGGRGRRKVFMKKTAVGRGRRQEEKLHLR